LYYNDAFGRPDVASDCLVKGFMLKTLLDCLCAGLIETSGKNILKNTVTWTIIRGGTFL